MCMLIHNLKENSSNKLDAEVTFRLGLPCTVFPRFKSPLLSPNRIWVAQGHFKVFTLVTCMMDLSNDSCIMLVAPERMHCWGFSNEQRLFARFSWSPAVLHFDYLKFARINFSKNKGTTEFFLHSSWKFFEGSVSGIKLQCPLFVCTVCSLF